MNDTGWKAERAAAKAREAVYQARADELHAKPLLHARELLELIQMDEHLNDLRDEYEDSYYKQTSFLAHVEKRLRQDMKDEAARMAEGRLTRDEWRAQERNTYAAIAMLDGYEKMTPIEQNAMWVAAFDLEDAAEKAEIAEAQALHDADEAAKAAS